MFDNIHIVGIDCAVDPQKVGLTSAVYNQGKIKIQEVLVGKRKQSISKTVFELCERYSINLIAIDAPLGWPQAMGNELLNHNAGDALAVEDNLLFRRDTDRFIKRRIGKQPLDIGADRIARTAYAALKILKELSELTTFQIPLAWDSEGLGQISVIEVYPAATLESHNIPNIGYKNYGIDPIKEHIISSLNEYLNIPEGTKQILADSNALDSVVCILAAKDFLEENTFKPENIELAKKEGWIWVNNPRVNR